MPLDSFQRLVDAIAAYSEKAVISLSLWGDPVYHSQLDQLVESVMRYPGLTLLIETAGIGWDYDQLRKWADGYRDRMIWIVSLDAMDAKLYQSIRGEGYLQAYETAHLLYQLFGKNCYQQALRIKGQDDDLEAFWDFWNEKGQPLIQKYDWFCGRQQQVKVVDLSPLTRFPCWHLKRDLSIWMDGSVYLCKEDLDKKHLLGNVFLDSLSSIFQAGDSFYRAQCRGDYQSICRGCDEYYTFNF